jgi:5,5'-dehydrodivanillate O-demethylase
MPAEPEDSTFKHRIKVPAYPVEALSGFVWAYLGPEPVPLLPRWDTLVRTDVEREIGITRMPINFLQAQENSLDPVHLEYLHARYMNYIRKRQGRPSSVLEGHHVKIGFDVFKYGITKRRLLEGQAEDVSDWTTGHPILFPTILSLGTSTAPRFEIRVPVDDTHTTVYSLFCSTPPDGKAPRQDVPIYDIPYVMPDGTLVVDTVLGQDMMAWVTQGDVSDRTTERLGASDRGIILYRAVLQEHMEKVERGEDPPGVIRDPEENANLKVHRESGAHYQGTYLAATGENHFDQVRGKRPVS